MLTAKLARKARAVGLEPDDGRDGQAALTLAALTARAGAHRSQADDPLAGDGGLDKAVGECLYAVANLAQRLGIDAEQALRDRRCRCATTSSRRRASPKPRWATASVVSRCPTRGDTQGEMS